MRRSVTFFGLLSVALAGCTGTEVVSAQSSAEVVPARYPAKAPTAWTTLPSGARHAAVSLARKGNGPQVFWLYLPPNATSARGLPCVFVAPAGTPLIHGADLGSPPEYVPYAKAGFAVVAYAIDGNVNDQKNAEELEKGIRAFVRADGGVRNAQSAMNYALKTLGVNPNRLYVAGHSSAGTLALQVAQKDPRVAGCIAYTPCSDIPAFLGEDLNEISEAIPAFGRYVMDSSPESHSASLRCPLFLFQAADDSVVSPATTRAYAAQVRRTNPAVTYVEVASGNHYNSMIQEGIPGAIAWLKKGGVAKKQSQFSGPMKAP